MASPKRKPQPWDLPPPSVKEVQESVSMVWTDATHLPPSPLQEELCSHLANATAVLDRMMGERDG